MPSLWSACVAQLTPRSGSAAHVYSRSFCTLSWHDALPRHAPDTICGGGSKGRKGEKDDHRGN
jgi:hypothetical protein